MTEEPHTPLFWAEIAERHCREKLEGAIAFWNKLNYKDGDGVLTNSGPLDGPLGTEMVIEVLTAFLRSPMTVDQIA